MAVDVVTQKWSLPGDVAKAELSDFCSPTLMDAWCSTREVVYSENLLPRGYWGANQREWRSAVRKMFRLGMLGSRSANSIDPRRSAGVFCVKKPDGSLRLICDRRVGNFVEELLGHADLPSSQRLSRILLPPSHRTSQSDTLRTSRRPFADTQP